MKAILGVTQLHCQFINGRKRPKEHDREGLHEQTSNHAPAAMAGDAASVEAAAPVLAAPEA